jgi:hypothetical protein
VEKQNVVSDEQFTREFRWLAATIKTLSRKVCLPEAVQLAEISEFTSAVLLKSVDKAQWSGRGRKKAVVEAFIWSALITAVFDSPFEVFGVEAKKVAKVWFELFRGAHSGPWPTPSGPAERWRCVTVEHLMQHSGKGAVTHGSPGTATRLSESISNKRDEVHKYLFGTMGRVSPTSDFSQLSEVINKAFSLALEMSLQRCRLQVVPPLIGDAYSQGQTCHMTSIDEDGELEEGTVAFIVQPGLMKWGDGHGKKLDHNLVLVPSEVYILPLV